MANLYSSDTPSEVKEAKNLHLLTQNTPNGKKIQIVLEELALLYGTEFTTTLIDISTNEQKKDWFLRLNPNGKIPLLMDNSGSQPFPIFETSAEMLYVVDKYDTKHELTFEDAQEKSEMFQWLFFWHGGGQPIMGQFAYWNVFNKEKVPQPIERFRTELLRVYGVIELHLSGKLLDGPRNYLAGKGKGRYSIADIGIWSWVYRWQFVGLTEEDMKAFPNLTKWIDRIAERPAVKTGSGDKYDKK